MATFKENFIKYWKSYLIAFLVALILGVIVFLLYFLLKDRTLYDALNASTLSAVIIFCLGAFIFVGSFGFFDMLSYGANQTFHFVFSRKPNKYHDYPGYLEAKKAKREHSPNVCYSFFLVAILFVIAIVALEICIHN